MLPLFRTFFPAISHEWKICLQVHVREMFDIVPSQDKTFVNFPDALHDLEHDYVKGEWRDAVMGWVNARL